MELQLRFARHPTPEGPLAAALIPWDTEIFGFPVVQLDVAQASPDEVRRHLPALFDSLGDERPCLAVTSVAPDAVAMLQALCECGMYPVEVMVDVVLDLRTFQIGHVPAQPDMRLRAMVDADLPGVLEIAARSFREDRLHLDPHVPDDAASRRYVQWVHNARTAGEPIYVFEQISTGAIAGFFNYRTPEPGVLYLSLIAVDRRLGGRGVGTRLVEEVLELCRQNGYHTMLAVVSLNNLRIVNVCSTCGTQFVKAVTKLHWFRPARSPVPPVARPASAPDAGTPPR